MISSKRSGMHRTLRHRTQAQRSERMRRRLIEATIACLAQDGYARTTIRRIVARARVSHGATGHHFRNKAGLMTAAAEELVRRRQQMLQEVSNRLSPGAPRPAARTGNRWLRLQSTPLMRAFLELSVAAPREQGVANALQSQFNPGAGALGADAASGDEDLADRIAGLTSSLMLGMAVQYHSCGEHPLLAAQLETWERLVAPHLVTRRTRRYAGAAAASR